MSDRGQSVEIVEFKERYRKFINKEVIPAEPILDEESERSAELMAELKASAKRQGLWALGHPEEIGGGGLPFMDFVYMNEVIGRSHYGQMAVG
jgi:alkylation response protein AidB-like acyl-CoA dehydrogenase